MSSAEVEPSSGWVPAFPGQRPPFPTTHGAYTPKIVGRAARRVHRQMSRAWPGLAASWPLLLSELAQVTARTELLRQALEDPTVTGRDTLLKHLTSAERQKLRLMSELGMTPASQARVLANLAHAEQLGADVDRIRAEGRQWVAAYQDGQVLEAGDESAGDDS